MLKGEDKYDHALIGLPVLSCLPILVFLSYVNWLPELKFGTNVFALCYVSPLMVIWFVIFKKEEFVESILYKVLLITTQMC